MWDGRYQTQPGKLLPFLVCFLVSYQYQYVNQWYAYSWCL